MALVDLIQTAVDSGLGSQRCEQVADILIAMSSINVRAHVLKALRKVSHCTVSTMSALNLSIEGLTQRNWKGDPFLDTKSRME